MNWL
jgi:hypothetical protein